jgi:primosomal protein N'
VTPRVQTGEPNFTCPTCGREVPIDRRCPTCESSGAGVFFIAASLFVAACVVIARC